MKKKTIISAALMLAMVFSCINMSACILNVAGDDRVTRDEVQQMIDNGMNGNITVEGGDNYDVVINTGGEQNVVAGKALLSAVSVKSVFETYSSGFPGYGSSSKEKASAGSGVIYSLDKEHGNAYIVTNYHVVYYSEANTENGISDEITVYLYGQESQEYAIPATYVGGSMNYDLAVLKVEGSRVLAESNAMAAEFADSDEVAVLDRAVAVGNPEALGISATLGYVNVDSEYITLEGADGATTIRIRVMRIDTAVNSGNSGGGLYNSEGNLIGIVNAKLAESENMGYAIPSNFVKYVCENIIHYCAGGQNENVYRCYLGITVGAKELYTVYDTETGRVHKREVVAISSIEDNSIALGKLQIGDVINSITIDGTTYDVTRMYVVTDAMLNARVGSVVKINVTRNGVSTDVVVSITESSLTKVQ